MQLLVPFDDGIVLLGWHTHFNRNLEGNVFTLYMYVQNGSIYWLKCNGKNSSGSYPISSGCIKSDPYVELYPHLFARLVCWGISQKNQTATAQGFRFPDLDEGTFNFIYWAKPTDYHSEISLQQPASKDWVLQPGTVSLDGNLPTSRRGLQGSNQVFTA